MNQAQRSYDAAARAMHDTERKIANLTRWERPSPDSCNGRILASLEARRDRDTPALIALKIAADAATPSRLDQSITSDIRFKAQEWQPAGTVTPGAGAGEIPECLRRVRA